MLLPQLLLLRYQTVQFSLLSSNAHIYLVKLIVELLSFVDFVGQVSCMIRGITLVLLSLLKQIVVAKFHFLYVVSESIQLVLGSFGFIILLLEF